MRSLGQRANVSCVRVGIQRAAVLLALLAAAACDPVFVLPGGALSGTDRPMPEDWSFTRDVYTMQLETRPSDPYSVNVWGVEVNHNLYVASDGGVSRWAKALETEPHVRLRVGDDIYRLRAHRADDPRELEDVVDAYIAKYGGDREQSFVNSAWVYRLSAR